MKAFRDILSYWLLFFFLTIPFSFEFLPELGKGLFYLLEPVLNWISEIVFNKKALYGESSDGILSYSLALFCLLMAIFLFGLIELFLKSKKDVILQVLKNFLLLVIVFFLLHYGIDKLTGNQFYSPRGNTLFTPLGGLSKDIAYWSLMGSSRSYQIFMGIIEVIPAFLILYNRTRFLGLIIAFGVLTNVFFVNIGFDITVKLLSFGLVMTSIYLLSFYKSKFLILLNYQTENNDTNEVSLENHLPNKIYRTLKYSAFIFLLIEISLRTITSYQTATYNSPTSSFEITSSGSEELFQDIKRIHIHPSGYIILENENQQFKDYKTIGPIIENQFVLKHNNQNYVIQNKTGSNEYIFLNRKTGNEIMLKKINLTSLPLNQDGTHFSVEDF